MRPNTLPIKRRPVHKGVFHKLSAVTRSRKQRVAAAPAAGDVDVEDGSSRVSRALTIIFLIHIVAIGLIFIHQHFLDGRGFMSTPDSEAKAAPAAPPVVREELPQLSDGDRVYVVKPGDNYERIASRENVDVEDLRAANEDVEIRPGLILSVPPRRIVAQEPPEVVELRQQSVPSRDDGLVEAVDVAEAPRAVLVRPNLAPAEEAPKTASTGRQSYVVKSGDNIWRISQKFKVTQDELMKANGITDARKVRVGATLVIP